MTITREVSLPLAGVRQHPEKMQCTEGGIVMTCDGSYSRNMRAAANGGLETMAGPKVLNMCNYHPIWVDVRYDVRYIFTLDDAGCLRMEVSVMPDGTITFSTAALGYMSPGACKVARAGDFLIFSDSQDRLYYAEWNHERRNYSWLGSFPAMPDFSVESSDEKKTQGIIPAITFATPVSDLRGGVPDEIAEQAAKNVSKAVLEAREQREEAGYWTGPVMVRIAIRMWDGTLLYLSAPQLVAPTEYVSPRRVLLPLTSSNGAYSGTVGTPFSITSYHLKVSLDTSGLSGWRELASQIEVWVTREPTVKVGTQPTVGFNSASHLLAVTPDYSSEEELTQLLQREDWLRMAVVPVTGGETTSVVVKAKETEEILMNESVPIARVISHASVISGHGGFLHLAGYTRSLPSPMLPRGEPQATEEVEAIVTVTLNGSCGRREISASGTIKADAGLIMPPLWYPDRRATNVRVSLSYADGRKYEREWTMSPLVGENGAYVPFTTAESVSLLPVDEIRASGTAVVGEFVDSTLMTMHRGNPFVTCDTTSYAGGHISAILAQQGRGGAYTRQYLYLFSDTGIVALTHDMDGKHKNCRPVSRQTVTSANRIAGADAAVWILSDAGMLLRLSDSKVEILMRGLPPEFRLAPSDASGELWLIPLPESEISQSIVIDTADGRGLSVSHSDWIPNEILSVGPQMIGVSPRRFGNFRRWELAYIELPNGGAGRMNAEWVSPVIEIEKGGIATVNIGMTAIAPDVKIEVRVVPEHVSIDSSGLADDIILWSGELHEAVQGLVRVPLLLPDAAVTGTPLRMRIRVKGIYETISTFGVSVSDYV